MNWIKSSIISICAPSILLTFNTATAQAAPEQQKSSDILRSVETATGGIVPIRRGFYDEEKQVGFGQVKACERHLVCNLSSIAYVLRSPIAVPKDMSDEDEVGEKTTPKDSTIFET
ncbi:MAG: hypothetical protein ACREP9_11770 [Candidatus Dormibacteraceae bacterium]